MDIIIRTFFIIAGVLAALVLLVWIGLQIRPKSFPPYPQKSQTPRTVPLPAGLPAPVERFYRIVYGDQIPVIESMVISGRATLRPAGPITLPGRFRITHIAGQGYRHYIEACLFGIPILKVNERYVDGVSLFNIPFLPIVENDPKYNQGANLGLWAESIWLPAIFLTDPRVRWEPVDDVTALLIVPFENSRETFVVRFDERTGLIDYFESMRYHGADSPAKTLWINHAVEWSMRNGKPYNSVGSAIWMDDGKPWAVFTVEEVVYNTDVEDYIRATGL